MQTSTSEQFILLPPRGLTADAIVPSTASVRSFLKSLKPATTAAAKTTVIRANRMQTRVRVLDSIRENGAKLVELSLNDVSALRAQQPGLRIIPVVYYYTAEAPRPSVVAGPKTALSAKSVKLRLQILSAADGSPVPSATVVAFTDFANRLGAQGLTNEQGIVSLALGGESRKLQRLYIYADGGFWNLLRKSVTVKSGGRIRLRPLNLEFTDSLRHFYGTTPLEAGAGVTVGVIDTGIEPHPDLVIAGGANTVTGENPKDFADNGDGHGTHVAGIIAARGMPPIGIRGLAPGVTLRSYRVFGRNSQGASNFAIAKAIDRAVSDKCDIINMSLGGGLPDEATHSAMANARASGVVVFAANGNDGRRPVSSPATDSLALAVSALGRKRTYPPSVTQSDAAMKPYGKDKKNYIAAFSNIGPETDLTAPGVGVISTFPGGHAVLDGTSMACPAVVGAAARLLADRPDLRKLSRNQARSDAIVAMVLQAAKQLGFGGVFEGRGLL